jgi:hypothetical protein
MDTLRSGRIRGTRGISIDLRDNGVICKYGIRQDIRGNRGGPRSVLSQGLVDLRGTLCYNK